MTNAKKVALCGMSVAICLVILLVGGWIGVGTYAAPLLAGILLCPAGKELGRKYQCVMWLAAGLLGLFLVTDLEESVLFLGFFGWYPALRPQLARLPKGVRIAVKLLIFNAAVVALEALLLLVLLPDAKTPVLLLLLLLAVGNVVFLLYDRLLPKLELLYERRLRRVLFPKR